MMTNTEPKKVLIVGDWVVDEYWFIVRHHSDMSAHTGFVHYRLASIENEIVTDLCGAGHVARLLDTLKGPDHSSYELIGMGLWNHQDTEFIAHLVHSREDGLNCPASRATFRVVPRFCETQPKIDLITLSRDSPTVRVVRSYHEGSKGLEQINRIDWEPRPSANPQIDWSEFDSQLPDVIDSIVVYDRQKGAITSEIIQKLTRKYPQADWYVKSKEVKPEWLKGIQNRLRLLVIGPEVASAKNPWGRWLINDKISGRTLDALVDRTATNVALLSDFREVIVRVNATDSCITGSSGISPTPITQLGWSSAFFGSLVYRLIMPDRASCELDQDDIEFALDTADEQAGVPMPLQKVQHSVSTPARVSVSGWKQEEKEWHEATRGMGLIEDQDGLRLDVWRGSSLVPGYVSCIKGKKEILDDIGHHLRAFSMNGSNSRRSLSLLLQAGPGSGKTFLAKSLARMFDFDFLNFDVTQMVHREELQHLFDRVAAKQASNDSPVLVFVDEINGLVAGDPVYGSFLSPLEEGIYARAGNNYEIRPCIWVFAGTDLSESSMGKSEKLSDFKSRMTIIHSIDFASLKKKSEHNKAEMEAEAKLEQVYLAAILLRKYFSDVQTISYEMVERIYQENPADSSARNLSKMISSLRNVQYGRVTRHNAQAWDGKWVEEEDPRTVRLNFS